MRALLFAAALCALLGCAQAPTKAPEVTRGVAAVEPQKIPVVTPCLTREQIPEPPATWMRTDKSGDYNETAAAIDLKELRRYLIKSQSLMWGCAFSFEEATQ